MSKDYRLKFSKAYKVLYQGFQDSSRKCCFLPEILDSAQEAFPFLWVNGEKYVFSNDVLDHGRTLFKSFCALRRYLARLTRKLQHINDEEEEYQSQTVMSIKDLAKKREKLVKALKQIDEHWALYEKSYVFELMVIEKDARRFII